MTCVVKGVPYRSGKRPGDISAGEIREVIKQPDTFVWPTTRTRSSSAMPTDTFRHTGRFYYVGSRQPLAESLLKSKWACFKLTRNRRSP